MNELGQLAQECVKTIEDMWADERLSVIGRDNVVTVIRGYQDLLRRVLSLCEDVDTADNQDMAEHWDWLLGEIRSSIPEGDNNA